MKNRIGLIDSIIKGIVSQALLREVDTNTFGLITVTRVVTVKALDSTEVYVSATKNDHKLLEYLKTKVYDIQQALNENMSRAKVPKIIFRLDDTSSYVAHIEDLINKID